MKNFIYRKIAGDSMLIPTGKMVTKYNGLFMMTPTAGIIYESIINGKTRDEIVSIVLDKFDIDKSTVKKDVDMFINELKEKEIF